MSNRRLPVLFVTRELPALAQKRLQDLTTVEVRQHNSTQPIGRQELLEAAAQSDGIVCLLSDAIDLEFIQTAAAEDSKLKVVSTVSVGYDHVDVEALKKHGKGIRLGYTPDVLTDATADTTVLLALMAARRVKEALNIVTTGAGASQFSLSRGLGVQFTGKTLGIVGFGRIGRATATRMLAFGVSRVLYSGSRPPPKESEEVSGTGSLLLDAAELVSFDQLLAESDLVCICCPLNHKTRSMFDNTAFAKMKRSAILVNTARGAIVNQDHLLDALNSNVIAHAALDVTVPEPIPTDHPLVLHPRCTILPHIGSATEETRNAMANLAIDNALAGIFGESLKAEVHL